MPSIFNQERENLCHLSCWPAGQCNNAQTMYLFSLYHSQTVAYWPLLAIKTIPHLFGYWQLQFAIHGGIWWHAHVQFKYIIHFQCELPEEVHPSHFPHTVRQSQVLSSAPLPFRHCQLDHILSTPAVTRKRTLKAAVRPTTQFAQIAFWEKCSLGPASRHR